MQHLIEEYHANASCIMQPLNSFGHELCCCTVGCNDFDGTRFNCIMDVKRECKMRDAPCVAAVGYVVFSANVFRSTPG